YRVIPGFYVFRFPEKFFGLAHFGISILAGFGFTALCERTWKGDRRFKAVFFVGASLLLTWLYFSPSWIERRFVSPSFWSFHLASSVLVSLALLLLALLALLLPRRSFREGALVALALIELFHAHGQTNPTQPASLYRDAPSAALWLKEHVGNGRILTLT